MAEKISWEIVDDTGHSSTGKSNVKPSLENLLGPWWRWKVAGLATVAIAAIALLVTVTGIMVLGLAAIALVSFACAKLVTLVRLARSASHSSIKQNSPPL